MRAPALPERDKAALIVTVPEAEASIREFRERFDISAICGLPAHVTILAPFLRPEAVSAKVITDLQRLFGNQPRFEFSLVGVCGFPSVVYLVPDPFDAFDALTRACVDRFPDCPPYGGVFEKPVPHLTVAQRPPADDLDAVTTRLLARVGPSLPVRCLASAVCLATKRAGRWSIDERFELA